jgi:hypothetical protein
VGADSFCTTGNGQFQLGDIVVLRRLLLEVQELSCATCAPQTSPSAGHVPADVAPRGRPNGLVDIADVVVLLRMAVGLDAPTPEELLRADIAPAVHEQGGPAVGGDGEVNIGDVVLGLRASVRLETLRWQERELAFHVDAPVGYVAFMAAVIGWPAWAALSGEERAECLGDGELSLEASGDRVGVTCVTDPRVVSGPGDAAAIRYRAPKAVGISSLSLRSELVDSALETIPTSVRMVAR